MFQTFSPEIYFKLQSSTDGINWTDEGWDAESASVPGNQGPELIETIAKHNLGGITYLSWVATGNLISLSGWWLDDITIDTGPVFTVNPTKVEFGYIPFGSTSMSQPFQLAGYNLNDSSITISAPSGFGVSLSPGGPYNPSVGIICTPPLLADTTIYTNFTPTAPHTSYLGNILCSGGGATKNLPVSGYSEIYYGYCQSKAEYDYYGSDIYNVTVGSLNNASNCYTLAPGPGSVRNTYSNYFFDVPVPGFAKGDYIQFSLSVGLTCNNSVGYNAAAIYIDFNQDADFLDSGEQVYVSPNSGYGQRIESGYIYPGRCCRWPDYDACDQFGCLLSCRHFALRYLLLRGDGGLHGQYPSLNRMSFPGLSYSHRDHLDVCLSWVDNRQRPVRYLLVYTRMLTFEWHDHHRCFQSLPAYRSGRIYYL
jgi:hypothetical protein